ncbi:hypothetical protein CASFOL_013821 [Castilleja foliolosa]|uniref:AUGMIN subunit 8-like n=1 Tax=Castilleja foliolosa TaxID=1961234 RepID=A0ABD3DMU8_9LAMI
MDICEPDKNGPHRRSRTREVSSRYKSPTPSARIGPKRCPSPNISRASSVSAPKRSVSAERKSPSTPSRPSTPVRDTSKTAGNKLPESLWPSTMQREKTVSRAPSDRTLRPSSNVSRKDEKPVDVTDKMKKSPSSSLPRMVTIAPSRRRLSLDGMSKPSHKSASDLLMLLSRDESGTEGLRRSSVDDRCSLWAQRPSSSRSRPASPSVSRGLSPLRAKAVNTPSRGTSPARVRPSSPSRNIQSSTPVLSFNADIKKAKKVASNVEDVHQLRLLHSRHLQWRFANAQTDAAMHSQKEQTERTLYSVWRIIVDLLDWTREKRSNLQQLKFKLKLYSILYGQTNKSYSTCTPQATFLDKWSSMERDHTNSLTWAIQDLQDSTLRIPVTGGAMVDIKNVEVAVCSAIDVMSSIGSPLCSIFSHVEGMNRLVSELAELAARERSMLEECESLLSSTDELQMEEYSLRTHLLQTIQAWKNDERSKYGY